MITENDRIRTEFDTLGSVEVPLTALYGPQTARALETYKISDLRIHPAFYQAYLLIKAAAAEANMQVGRLPMELARAIIQACQELLTNFTQDEFNLDVFQAGAGTSYNMNINEVVANRALEINGQRRGEYETINPNDQVNQAQSTNDTMPTAMRIATLKLMPDLINNLEHLAQSLANKSKEFESILKSGRTHLQDAVPMRLGEEFEGYGGIITRSLQQLRAAAVNLHEVPLGGSAVGNGVNVPEGFPELAVEQLAKMTNLSLQPAANRFQSMQSLGDFVALSSALRANAIELNKIANDIRLLSSGPHTGLDEIELPPVQAGSSIMPGKINPSIPEMMNMVCFHIIGHDAAIMLCGEAGQLELNVMMPYVAYALLEMIDILTRAVGIFDQKCVRGIRAHPQRCLEYAERTNGLATLLNNQLGYAGAAKIAMRARSAGKSINELLNEENQNQHSEEREN